MMNTAEKARGRWVEVLMALGVARKFLRNSHGPCPLCGGKDRFRFDNKEGDGTYFCNQCGAGNGLSLVKKLKKWNHGEACQEVERILGERRRPAMPAPGVRKNDAQKLVDLERLLDAAVAPGVVDAYLAKRGLADVGEEARAVLCGHPACAYYGADKTLMGKWPAVLAPVTGPKGQLVSVQRIYDHPAAAASRKKLMPTAGTVVGAAVRLGEIGEELGVAEGVETALAATLIFGIPTWATISAQGMESVVIPGTISRLHVFGDNDASYTGQAAAYVLAKRVKIQCPGVDVRVNIPPDTGQDWLDVWASRPRS